VGGWGFLPLCRLCVFVAYLKEKKKLHRFFFSPFFNSRARVVIGSLSQRSDPE
jgi:hypothetical protein